MRFFSSILLTIALAGTPIAAEMMLGRETSAEAGKSLQIPTRSERLDELYQRLATTGDSEEALGIIRQIERIHLMSGSPTADLLLERVGRLIANGDLPLASELFEKILVLTPQWPEAWYRRALLFHLTGDEARATTALLKTLSLEPRHLPALQMLGALYSGEGNEKNALFIYRQALAVYPGSTELQTIVHQLELKVEGKNL